MAKVWLPAKAWKAKGAKLPTSVKARIAARKSKRVRVVNPKKAGGRT